MPKIGNLNIFGHPNSYGGPQYSQVSTINKYKFIERRHDILIQCQWNYMEMEKLKYMLKIDILRNSSQKNLGVLRGAF